jgi:AcrR family transcriptional regulator
MPRLDTRITTVIIRTVAAVTSPAAGPAETTRGRLVAAAIEVFAAQGYDGARVQDIARTAGLTTGAIYANYRGKAELLFDAIGALAGVEVDALLAQASGREARDVLEHLGALLAQPRAGRPALLLDAVVAARRDPDLAALLRARMGGREAQLCELLDRAQAEGAIDEGTDAETLAYYCTTLAMGALVMRTLDHVPPDQDQWQALIHRLVDALAPTQERGK